ncbi:PDT-domain-containing protein [Xylona heveae TC161]|uniref:prephenate dehydratase n=1 Tax=Xylona heveae (strain CBS 132557 / TC161) TaxID=1328760 RepID=A0A165FSK5_XYLHT|nr:PDT-domain-containing protein [Xylona heveae TC161]KZF21324.1 PDT-domain-containing protein [Xylona heveae TC161]
MHQRQALAYLGPSSSYSHQAALEYFNRHDYIFEAQGTIQDIFTGVQSGSASLGVVPFENSTNGSVVFSLDLFADRERTYRDIHICGETYLNVHHNLLGFASTGVSSDASPGGSGDATPTNGPRSNERQAAHGKPVTKPLASLSHIRRLYSHPQAFGQCEAFLSRYLNRVERQEVSSTSKAAELVAQDKTNSSAAIASKVAAEIHGLDTLARGIEDREDNTTRFLVIRKGEETAEPVAADEVDSRERRANYKTMVTFTIEDGVPGSLTDALMVFREHDLNLTGINSRPSRLTPWNYVFFLEFEGSRLSDPSGRVNSALEALGKVAKTWRWLGSWKAAKVTSD